MATDLFDLCRGIKFLDFNVLAVLPHEWTKYLLDQGMRSFHVGPKVQLHIPQVIFFFQ